MRTVWGQSWRQELQAQKTNQEKAIVHFLYPLYIIHVRAPASSSSENSSVSSACCNTLAQPDAWPRHPTQLEACELCAVTTLVTLNNLDRKCISSFNPSHTPISFGDDARSSSAIRRVMSRPDPSPHGRRWKISALRLQNTARHETTTRRRPFPKCGMRVGKILCHNKKPMWKYPPFGHIVAQRWTHILLEALSRFFIQELAIFHSSVWNLPHVVAGKAAPPSKTHRHR